MILRQSVQGINRILALTRFQMGMLTDRLTDRQQKKQEEAFKKEIEGMANKPSFTLMDYKQRVLDELSSIKSGLWFQHHRYP